MLLVLITILVVLGSLAWYLFNHCTTSKPLNVERDVYGKKVLVTGASSGIGREMAVILAGMGAHVFVTARREAELQETVDMCRAKGRADAKYGYCTGSMSQFEDTDKVVQACVECLGGMDYLVLNHALMKEQTIENYPYTDAAFSDLRDLFNVNFFSYVKLLQHAMPHLRETKGRVAVVNSISGRMGSLMLGGYAATKHALAGFMEAINQENHHEKSGVTVTSIFAGNIDTASLRRLLGFYERKLGWNVKEMVDTLCTPQEAATEIIRATANREVEVYYPPQQWLKFYVMMKHIFPRSSLSDL